MTTLFQPEVPSACKVPLFLENSVIRVGPLGEEVRMWPLKTFSMTTSLVSEDALWRSLPHIWLLEKWWPLPDLDLAIIVKQILSSTTY